MQSLRKSVINTSIVLYLWMVLSTNLSSIATLADAWEPIRQLPLLRQLDQWVGATGSHLAIRYGWRMFTPPEGYYYTLELRAGSTTGPAERVVLPHQQPRSWWQRNFVDAREEKFLVNLYYNDPIARQWYARYWCQPRHRRGQKQTVRPQTMQIDIMLHSFAPPAPTVRVPWGIWPCARTVL